MALERIPGGWRVRLRYGKGQRGRFAMPEMTRAQAEQRAARLERMAAKLSAAGKHIEAKLALERAAQQSSEKDFASVERAVDELAREGRSEAAGTAKKRYTFRDVAELWLSGEIRRRYPDDVPFKGEKSVDMARGLLSVIYPAIGEIPVEQITVEDAEAAKQLIPEGLTQSTRRHYAILIRRVMALAEYPLRLIERSPIPKKFVPSEGKTRVFPFMYPEEEAQLMRCVEDQVRLGERLAYGFMARNGCRPGETAAFTWGDFDLLRGHCHLDKNKTRNPRSWQMSPDVVRALQGWRELSRERGVATGSSDRVFHEFTTEHVSRRFRMQLKACGLDRAHLHALTTERRPMRVHDLRGTFVTVALASGRTEDWVMRHTGHTTSNMIAKYRRQVDALHLRMGWFYDLDVLLGLGQKVGQEPNKPPESGGSGTPLRSRESLTESQHEPAEAEAEKSRPSHSGAGPAGFPGVGQPAPEQTKGAEEPSGHIPVSAAAPADPLAQAIADLAHTIRLAAEAGQWPLVARLTGQLEALKVARAGVTSLDDVRGRKNGGDK